METFIQLLTRLDYEYPAIRKVTKKALFYKWLDGERMPTHKQMMKIIKVISETPYKMGIWQRVILTTILGEKKHDNYDDIYLFDIHPVPCPRPRFTKYGRPYMPPKYMLWKKELVRQIEKKNIPRYDTPIAMDIEFWFYSENKPWGLHIQKPDIDNLQKGVLDAWQDAKIIPDDCIVHTIQAKKIWGYEPKIIVKIKK